MLQKHKYDNRNANSEANKKKTPKGSIIYF